MQLKLYLEIHYPSERHADIIRIADRSHIRARRLQQVGTQTETILIADQCADLAKFGEFTGGESIPVVYHVEDPFTPKRWNYVPEEKWEI